MAETAQMIFRSAKIEDIKEMSRLIQELAEYEKMGQSPQLTEEDLIRDSGLAGGKAMAHYFLLELIEKDDQNPYSSWIGKVYYLDNFYVRPDYCRIGAGERLFREIAAKALEHGCKRLDVNLLAWDPARKFYEKLGASDNTETEQRHFYRLHEKEINEVVKQLDV